MTVAPTNLADQVSRLLAGEADAADAVFMHVEEAALRDLESCLAEVRHELGRLPEGHAARIPCLKGLAHALCYANRFHDAIAALQEAELIAAALGREEDAAAVALTAVQPLERLGRAEEAEQAARRSYEVFTRRGIEFQAGRALVNLGVVRRVRGDALSAVECFERARPALASSVLAVATVETNLAEAYQDLDRLDDAALAFARARDLFDQARHPLGAAIAEGNLADAYSRMGRVDEALVLFEHARTRFRGCHALDEDARLGAEEAEAMLIVGAYQRAARLYREAIPGLDQPGMTIEHARAMVGFGTALLRMGAIRRGCEVLRTALERCRGEAVGTIADDAALALAEGLHAAGDTTAAHAALTALEAAWVHRPIRLAQALCLLAAISLRDRNPGRAGPLLDRAAAIAPAWNLAPLRSRIRHLRALRLVEDGQPEPAWQELHAAMTDAERVRGSLRSEQVRACFLESSRQLYQDAVDLADRLGGPLRAQRTFDAVERLRARTLVETVAGRAAKRDPGGAEAVERGLDAAYRALAAGDARSDTDLRSRIESLEASLESHDLRRQAAGGPLATRAPLTLARAEALADPDRPIIEFFRVRDRLRALVIARGRARISPDVMSVAEAATMARRYALSLDLAALGGDAAAANRDFTLLREHLSRALLPDLGGAGSAAVVLSRELRALPVCAALCSILPREGPGGGVSILPGVTAGFALRSQSEGSPARRCLIVGVGDAAAPAMENEARLVASHHEGGTLLTGARATADAVLDQVPGHSILHLACHCVFDGEFPSASRLRLSDRWITARELADRLSPRTVVILAGCESGRTSDTTGDDRFGLPRSLLTAGASMVVGSMWRIHDAAAAMIFPELHRRLAADPGPAERSLVTALSGVTAWSADRGLEWHAWQGIFAKGMYP